MSSDANGLRSLLTNLSPVGQGASLFPQEAHSGRRHVPFLPAPPSGRFLSGVLVGSDRSESVVIDRECVF